MKKVTDMDGNEQRSFLDAPVIDCKFLPSKKALEFRLSQTIDLIEKGDRDYARYHDWKGLSIKEGDRHLTTKVLIDGQWWNLAQVRGIQKFVATWLSRKAYLMDDCRDLQKSIELAE